MLTYSNLFNVLLQYFCRGCERAFELVLEFDFSAVHHGSVHLFFFDLCAVLTCLFVCLFVCFVLYVCIYFLLHVKFFFISIPFCSPLILSCCFFLFVCLFCFLASISIQQPVRVCFVIQIFGLPFFALGKMLCDQILECLLAEGVMSAVA